MQRPFQARTTQTEDNVTPTSQNNATGTATARGSNINSSVNGSNHNNSSNNSSQTNTSATSNLKRRGRKSSTQNNSPNVSMAHNISFTDISNDMPRDSSSSLDASLLQNLFLMSNNPNDNRVIVVAPGRRESTPTPPIINSTLQTTPTATSTPSSPSSANSASTIRENIYQTAITNNVAEKNVMASPPKKKESEKENDRESGISISSTTSNEMDNYSNKKKQLQQQQQQQQQQHISRAKRSKLLALDKKAEKEREREKIRDRQLEKEKEREREREKLKAKELEKEKQKEKEREREKEKQEREKLREREKRERERRFKEQQEKEQREREEQEREQEKLKELEKEQKQKEYEKQQKELEKERERERERQKEVERQKELELKKQKEREKELERERERKKERERQLELEREREIKRQKEREKEIERKKERERQKELEREREKERKRERDAERKRKEKYQALKTEAEPQHSNKILEHNNKLNGVMKHNEENNHILKSEQLQNLKEQLQVKLIEPTGSDKDIKQVNIIKNEDKSPPNVGNNKELMQKHGKTPGRERRKDSKQVGTVTDAPNANNVIEETEQQRVERKCKNKAVQALVFNSPETSSIARVNSNSSGSESASPSCLRSPWEAGSQVTLGDLIQPRQVATNEIREIVEMNAELQSCNKENELGPIGSRKSPSSTPLWESVQKQQSTENLQFPKPIITNNSSFFSNLPGSSSPNLNSFGLGEGQFMGIPSNLYELQKVQMELQRQLQTNEFIINLHQQQQRLQQQQELLQGAGDIAAAATTTMASSSQWANNNAAAWSPMGYRQAVGLNLGNNNKNNGTANNNVGNVNGNLIENGLGLRMNGVNHHALNNANNNNLAPWQQLGLSRPPPGLNASPNHLAQRPAQQTPQHIQQSAFSQQQSQQQPPPPPQSTQTIAQQQQQPQQQQQQQPEVQQFDPFKSLSSIWSDNWNQNDRNGN